MNVRFVDIGGIVDHHCFHTLLHESGLYCPTVDFRINMNMGNLKFAPHLKKMWLHDVRLSPLRLCSESMLPGLVLAVLQIIIYDKFCKIISSFNNMYLFHTVM